MISGNPKLSGDSQGVSARALKATGGALEQHRQGTIVLRRRVLYAMVVDTTQRVTRRRRQE